MARRLAQTQQGFEHLDIRPSAGRRVRRLSSKRAPIIIAQFIIKLAFIAFEIAINRLLGFCRQLFGHLAFGAAKNKRPQGARQDAPRGYVGITPHPAENRRAAEHARVEKLKQAPKLAQMVFHGRAAQRQSVIGLQQARRLGRQCAGIFYRLGFIEDTVIEMNVLKCSASRVSVP